jgi:hypothetical protein
LAKQFQRIRFFNQSTESTESRANLAISMWKPWNKIKWVLEIRFRLWQ